MADLWCL